MREKWIGEEINKTGGYHQTICNEIHKRFGSGSNKLYVFKSRFGEEYNISDEDVIRKIEELLATYEDEGGSTKLFDYIYSLIIERFGVIEFIVNIGHYVSKERNNSYVAGKKQMQTDMKSLLGIR